MQPSIALNDMIAVAGIFPRQDVILGERLPATGGSEPLLGQISLFAGNFAPVGLGILWPPDAVHRAKRRSFLDSGYDIWGRWYNPV